jgi:uncharacterized protein with HEPN domain
MRPDSAYLLDMLQAADAVAAFLADMRREDFTGNDLVRSAVLQKLLIIGEAAARLSEAVKQRYAQVPWNDIRGFRNLAVHAYFQVDWAIVWTIAKEHLPPLRTHVAQILEGDSA